MEGDSSDFAWPWQHDFPPFYTIQPNAETRRKQQEAWCSLILSYCKHKKTHQLDIAEISSSLLFHNKSIERRLAKEHIIELLDKLAKEGHVEWQDVSKTGCLVMWRTPAEWGKLIYDWVKGFGMLNTVCTLYELTNGDDSEGQEFHGIEHWLLIRALKTLQATGKAELISLGQGNDGVKFF
ncbi:vacuolar protein-sorting-associated protein 25-like [Watersipora subatra]|uniref:vacuolar protein-sorting-associated protein 25-like n=1 Tax=Watersipora subatra TaxID=2589382 RepID=UPI00355AD4A3